jgi:hypothetical protein
MCNFSDRLVRVVFHNQVRLEEIDDEEKVGRGCWPGSKFDLLRASHDLEVLRSAPNPLHVPGACPAVMATVARNLSNPMTLG